MDTATPADPPLQPQRKLITVLFADIKGSTEMVAALDPEDAWALIQPVLSLMQGAVNRFDGVVSKQAGDGVMAFFGAPVAVDDHAERACRAALLIHEEIAKLARPELQVRIGVHSGEVVLHQVRHDLSSVYDAAGPVVHIAQRAETLAPPGGTVISADCHALLGGRFEASPFRANVRGIDRELELFRLKGLKALGRWEARAAGGLSAFVGREIEREILAAAAEDVRRGAPRVITIEGEPGCGKSRLIHGALAGASFHGWEIWRCDAEATLRNVAWSVARKLLLAALKATDKTDLEELRERVGQSGGLGERERLALATLLGARIDNAAWGETQPEHRRNLIHAVFVKTLRDVAAAVGKPAAIVIEDLQWIDPESLAALTLLAREANGTTFLLLSTRRPAEERLAMPETELRIQLEPLAASEAELLVDGLLGDAAPDRLKHRIIDHTGGNPLFIEEIARHLIASGLLADGSGESRRENPLREIGLPLTIHSVIAARIDGLTHKARQLLQAASIFGSGTLRQDVCDLSDLPVESRAGAFDELERGAFLRLISGPEDAEIRFAHDLIQEVAYAGILRARRRELHRRVLDSLAARGGSARLPAASALYRHAAGAEDWPAAVGYARQAAAAAVEQSAYWSSIEYIDYALDALSRMPETDTSAQLAIDMRLEARLAFGATAQLRKMHAYAEEAERRAEAIHDRKRGLAASIQKATALVYFGAPDEALMAAKDALVRAQSEGVPQVEAVARYILGQVNYMAGDYRQAADLAVASERLLPAGAGLARLGTTGTTLVLVKISQATALASMGEFAAAAACIEQASGIAELTRRPYDVASLAYGAGYAALLQGRVADAIAKVEPAMAIARDQDIVFFQPVLGNLLGQAYLAAGRTEDSLRILKAAMQTAGDLGHVGARLGVSLSLGVVRMRLGELDAAAGLVSPCLDSARQQGYKGIQCNAARQLATLNALRGAGGKEIGRLLGEAIEVAAAIEARPSKALAQLALAELLARTGEKGAAMALLPEVAEAFGEMGMVVFAQRARQAIGSMG
jgi:class 3 adenylate cyclase/tetratricopeptide (TPR) repeat protein